MYPARDSVQLGNSGSREKEPKIGASTAPVRALSMLVALLSAWLGLSLFFLAPAHSTSAANANLIAEQSSTPSQTASQEGSDTAASVDEIASAKKAADTALDIVQDTLRDTAFVGPRVPGSAPRSGPHWGMYDLLESLNRAARAVSDDDGKNPASMKQRKPRSLMRSKGLLAMRTTSRVDPTKEKR